MIRKYSFLALILTAGLANGETGVAPVAPVNPGAAQNQFNQNAAHNAELENAHAAQVAEMNERIREVAGAIRAGRKKLAELQKAYQQAASELPELPTKLVTATANKMVSSQDRQNTEKVERFIAVFRASLALASQGTSGAIFPGTSAADIERGIAGLREASKLVTATEDETQKLMVGLEKSTKISTDNIPEALTLNLGKNDTARKYKQRGAQAEERINGFAQTIRGFVPARESAPAPQTPSVDQLSGVASVHGGDA